MSDELHFKTIAELPLLLRGRDMTELMSGHADATILGIGSLTPFIKAGRVRGDGDWVQSASAISVRHALA